MIWLRPSGTSTYPLNDWAAGCCLLPYVHSTACQRLRPKLSYTAARRVRDERSLAERSTDVPYILSTYQLRFGPDTKGRAICRRPRHEPPAATSGDTT